MIRKIMLAVAVFCFAPVVGIRAEIISTAYIRNYIQNKWGVGLPSVAGTIASAKYLYGAIDSVNLALNGVATSYGAVASDMVVAKTAADRALGDLIKRCAAGTFLDIVSNDCPDCGMGHYCAGGGSARRACTYGAIACPGANYVSDQPMPSGSGGLYDKPLTMDELASLPPTDISQWRLVFTDWPLGISCGVRRTDGLSSCSYTTLVNFPENGCVGTIGPGTYLFIVRYAENTGWQDDLGRTGYAWDYQMAVLTKPTGYKVFRTCNTQDVYLDTNNANFTAYTSKVTHYYRCTASTCQAPANVSNLTSVADLGIYIYELK